jgi:hypothetical protein
MAKFNDPWDKAILDLGPIPLGSKGNGLHPGAGAQTASEQILVTKCLAPLRTPDFMRLTSTEAWGLGEFATGISPPSL